MKSPKLILTRKAREFSPLRLTKPLESGKLRQATVCKSWKDTLMRFLVAPSIMKAIQSSQGRRITLAEFGNAKMPFKIDQ